MPPAVRALLEDRFWRPIAQESTLESVRRRRDPLDDPAHHPFLFSDHGVVHVRDIAEGVVQLVHAVDGVLLPARDDRRRRFVTATGVALTYLHDIGMADPTPEGRRIHPAFAAHAAFSADLDDVVDLLCDSDWCVVERLRGIDAADAFAVSVPVVLREVLSLSLAHSKSTVPAPRLDDREALRAQMQAVVLTPLTDLRAGRPAAPAPHPTTVAAGHYDDVLVQSFAWLTSAEPEHCALADDVVDAIRVLRAADALRQRGSTLRTAGGYEIFMEAGTGEAVYAIRADDGSRLLWVRVPGAITAGEANLRSAWVTPHGDLRVSFHRGSYLTATALARAVEATALAVDDVQADVLPSFSSTRPREGLAAPARDPSTLVVELERPRDRPAFAADVAAALLSRRPSLAGRVRVCADVEGADPAERDRYHAARVVGPRTQEAVEVLQRLGAVGVDTAAVDPAAAFEDVRRARVLPGEHLVRAGTPPSFVYLPTEEGLVVHPRGGYDAEAAHPWLPVGGTGAVRNAERNSDVVAVSAVEVVMIPAELFVREWFRPYEGDELGALINEPG